MDQPICWEVVEVKPRNLDRKGIYRDAIEDAEKRFFKGENHIRWESNKMATQTSIQATCEALKPHLNSRCKAFLDPQTH